MLESIGYGKINKEEGATLEGLSLKLRTFISTGLYREPCRFSPALLNNIDEIATPMMGPCFFAPYQQDSVHVLKRLDKPSKI